MQTDKKRRQERWKEEEAFFDCLAGQAAKDASAINPLVVQRYSTLPLRRRFSKEFRFRLLGQLTHKTVLDVGCGDGENTILLSKLGAQVTGIDISSRAVEVAKKRTEMSGVGGLVRFVVSPLEIAEFALDSFDVIWGDAILHHLIDELETVLRKLTEWAKPGALMVFAEPINFSQTLRKIRLMIPVRAVGTPGERPLERAEIRLVQTYIPDLKLRAFSLVGRLDRFILENCDLERASVRRRSLVELIALLDYALLSVPGIRTLAGTAVLYGHPRKSAGSASLHQ